VLMVFILWRYLLRSADTSRKVLWYPGEKCYIDPRTQTKQEFPSLSQQSDASIHLSVIIPSYNEQLRLPEMLNETLGFLHERQQRSGLGYELIVVDDGSRDETSRVAQEYVAREGVERMRLLKLHQNCGKGGAVKRGMLCARGKYLLMADADGATKFSDVERLEKQLQHVEQNGLGVAVGSRNLGQTEIKKSVFRNILTWGFHMIVALLCVRDVRDTQCGFKLFTRDSARLLFTVLHIERWAFDVELLYLAQYHRMPIVEVPVTWTEIAGSKVDPMWDSLKMARDLFKIRLMYLFGIWSHDASRVSAHEA